MPLNEEEIDQATLEAEEALRFAQEEMEKFEQGFAYKSSENFTDKPNDTSPIQEENIAPQKKLAANLEELSFVRLIDPIHIPSYLVEQIKNRLFPIDKFYDYLKILCTHSTENGPILNNTAFLYAITNVHLRQVKGFLFMFLDILNNSLIISQFSIDKEYWNKGEAVNFMLSYAKQLMKEISAKRIVWLTKNIKTCEQLGFMRSRETLMTFEGE